MDLKKGKKKEIFEKFLRNGMDISSLRFINDEDKSNLFMVYETYLNSMKDPDKDIEVVKNAFDDITVFINKKQVCMFEVTDEYTVLRCYSLVGIEDKDLEYCLTIFFLTMKELTQLITTLSEGLSKFSNKSKGVYSTLPPNTKKVVNTIKSIQDSIEKNLSNNKKLYKIRGVDKK